MFLPRGDGEYGRELPVDRRRPRVWVTSAELGDPEPTLGKPMGLVLERRTVPDLEADADVSVTVPNKSRHNNVTCLDTFRR